MFQDAEKYKIVVTAEFDAGEEGLRVIEAIDDRTFAALKQLKRKVGDDVGSLNSVRSENG